MQQKMISILYVAEIVGKAGILCVKHLLPKLKQQYAFDFALANADGVTNGAGLGKNHAGYLRKLGFSVLTGGDCIFYKKDMVDSLQVTGYVLRPFNFPSESPGRGSKLCTLDGCRIAVVSLLGMNGFSRVHGDNPFVKLDCALEKLRAETPYIIVDFHAVATAEKKAFAAYADGRVSAVIGSHGRVQTADERILERGTAAITDAGRTGSVHAVGGLCAKQRIGEYISGIPDWAREVETEACCPELQGVLLRLNAAGKADSIERIKIPLEEYDYA